MIRWPTIPGRSTRAFNSQRARQVLRKIFGGVTLNPIVDLISGTNIVGTSPVTAWSSATGTVAIDTLFGSPNRSPNDGLELNGSTQYATLDGTLSNFIAVTATGVFSLGLNLRIDRISGAQQCFLQTKGVGRGIFVGTNSAGNALFFRAFDSANQPLWDHEATFASLGISGGDEVRITVRGNGVNSEFTVNGTTVESTAISTQAGAHQFTGFSGRFTILNSGHFDGAINGLFYEPALRTVAQVQGALP